MQLKKQFIKTRTQILSTILFSILIPFENTNAQTVKLFSDQVHSNVGFSVSLAGGLTRITGKYTDFEISFTYVDSNVTKSKIEAAIKTVSINTGNAARDEHLAAADFFDAAKNPIITFNSDSIVKNDKDFIAFGRFQMHGITKNMQIPFSITGKNKDGAMGFAARCTVKRRDYLIGKDTLKPATSDAYISDDILVEIDFLAEPKKADK